MPASPITAVAMGFTRLAAGALHQDTVAEASSGQAFWPSDCAPSWHAQEKDAALLVERWGGLMPASSGESARAGKRQR